MYTFSYKKLPIADNGVMFCETTWLSDWIVNWNMYCSVQHVLKPFVQHQTIRFTLFLVINCIHLVNTTVIWCPLGNVTWFGVPQKSPFSITTITLLYVLLHLGSVWRIVVILHLHFWHVMWWSSGYTVLERLRQLCGVAG